MIEYVGGYLSQPLISVSDLNNATTSLCGAYLFIAQEPSSRNCKLPMSTTRSIGSAKDTSSNAEVGGTRDNVELVEQPSNESPPFSKNEGGLEGYLTIAGCFLAFYASFGFVTAFGVFQSYYESVLPTHSADDISWIGSIQLWCITGIAIPSVVLNAHLGPHITIAIGTFFIVFGVMMASLSTQYYQLLLSHGICSGIGIGLSFLPVIGLPNQWYNKNRALAVGLALSGSSVGGLIWPIMINQMINYDHVGFPWTMRAIGFIQVRRQLDASIPCAS